jgi:hypothetical protein
MAEAIGDETLSKTKGTSGARARSLQEAMTARWPARHAAFGASAARGAVIWVLKNTHGDF